jgi:hypothetical protein
MCSTSGGAEYARLIRAARAARTPRDVHYRLCAYAPERRRIAAIGTRECRQQGQVAVRFLTVCAQPTWPVRGAARAVRQLAQCTAGCTVQAARSRSARAGEWREVSRLHALEL